MASEKRIGRVGEQIRKELGNLLLKGLVGNYQRMMLLDLRKGALTEQGIRRYRADLAEAGELMAKLGGAA